MNENYQLYHGDCLGIMQQLLEDGVKVDLILTDPPYLMNYATSYRKNKSHDFCSPISNDNNPRLIETAMEKMFTLLKNGGAIYVFCNSHKIDYFKQVMEKYYTIKNILIWVKNNHTAGDLKGAYAKKTEFIIYATKGRHILNGRRDVDVLFFDRVVGKKQVHQNQKPTDLLEFIIQKSSKENELVLDSFMGSGSTGVACMNLNRKFIGIELEEKYYNIAEQRLQEATRSKQTTLI